MADKQFKIWASIEVNDNQIKTEFTKAWELAWESVAKWMNNKSQEIEDKIVEQIDKVKKQIDDLSGIDFKINVTEDEAMQAVDMLSQSLADTRVLVHNLWVELQESGQEGGAAYEELLDTVDLLNDTVQWAIGEMTTWNDKAETSFDDLKDSVDKTTEAVERLNDTAEKWISENRWVWKLIKFLWSARVMNFFYNNLNKIWTKLVELSWDSERLASKREPIQAKLEAVWWYIGKWLVPAVDNAIDEIGTMTDELTKTWQDWSSAMSTLQKWVYYVWQGFVAVMKIIKSFGQYFWTQIANMYVLATSFGQDVYDTAKSIIEWIWNTDNWEALWNNIKYWVVQWVNGAIESLNWMLDWIKDKLHIDLWRVDTFDPWTKQSYNFWDIQFERTKNALNDIARANNDLMDEVWKEWWEFWSKAKQWYKDLWNTAINTNKKIADDTKKTVWGRWWGGSKESVAWVYEQLLDEAKDVWKEMSNLVEEHQKSYDKLTEEIEKVRDEYKDLREDAKKVWEDAEHSLSDYNDKLWKTQSDAITELWQRYVDLQKELIWVDEWMKKQAKDLSWAYLGELQKEWVSEYWWYDLKKLIELKEQLDEIQLIEENTTEEQRKSEEFIKETSKTQEILNKLKEQEADIEEKKASAMEKQAIAQAMMNQEEWKQYIKTLTKNGEEIGTYYYDTVSKTWEKIHNTDNIEYAKQLESQVENLNEQLEQYRQEKNEEVEILIDTTARKIELEKEFQNVFEENAKKQEKELENLISLTDRLIAKKREYLSMWSSIHNAYWWSVLSWVASIVWENWPEQIIARQSSYIQPRNAWNSYNTVNNSNNLSINGLEFGNFNTIDDMLNALKEKLTYRS